MSFIVYILFSPTCNKYYIGHTGYDLHERLRKHNSNHNDFTGKHADWIAVLLEPLKPKKLLIEESDP